jgi:hypothetical protein
MPPADHTRNEVTTQSSNYTSLTDVTVFSFLVLGAAELALHSICETFPELAADHLQCHIALTEPAHPLHEPAEMD